MMKPEGVAGLQIRGNLERSYPEVLTAEALSVIAALAPLNAVRGDLMRARIERRAASFHAARARARSMGIDIAWDCEIAKTPEGFYQIQGGLEYAIAKSLAVAPFADILWMETKNWLAAWSKHHGLKTAVRASERLILRPHARSR